MTCLILMTLMLAAGILLYESRFQKQEVSQTNDNFIKWVDFNASKEALKKACLMDVESYQAEIHLNWITLLAYAAVRGGGEFNSKSTTYIDDIATQITAGEITKTNINIFLITMKRILRCLAGCLVNMKLKMSVASIRKSMV